MKANKLNVELLAYLRAHCLLFFPGEDFSKARVTVPSDLDYEIMVLKTYKKILDKFREYNVGRFDPLEIDDIEPETENQFHSQMIKVYRFN